MLLSHHGPRKFHLRVYVLACADMNVFVFDQILALFSLKPYSMDNPEDLLVHLTNTCLQVDQPEYVEEESVQMFWDLTDNSGHTGVDSAILHSVFDQVKSITAQVFEATSSEATMFQALPNAFEIFGLDFLVDDDAKVLFLEANAFPDFKQTGERLGAVIDKLFTETVNVALSPHPSKPNYQADQNNTVGFGKFHLVFEKKRSE